MTIDNFIDLANKYADKSTIKTLEFGDRKVDVFSTSRTLDAFDAGDERWMMKLIQDFQTYTNIFSIDQCHVRQNARMLRNAGIRSRMVLYFIHPATDSSLRESTGCLKGEKYIGYDQDAQDLLYAKTTNPYAIVGGVYVPVTEQLVVGLLSEENELSRELLRFHNKNSSDDKPTHYFHVVHDMFRNAHTNSKYNILKPC